MILIWIVDADARSTCIHHQLSSHLVHHDLQESGAVADLWAFFWSWGDISCSFFSNWPWHCWLKTLKKPILYEKGDVLEAVTLLCCVLGHESHMKMVKQKMSSNARRNALKSTHVPIFCGSWCPRRDRIWWWRHVASLKAKFCHASQSVSRTHSLAHLRFGKVTLLLKAPDY